MLALITYIEASAILEGRSYYIV